jgi:hypothetical protein
MIARTIPARWRAAAALAVTVMAAGCASTPSTAAAPQPQAPAQLSAATSLTYQGHTWAAIPMGTTGPNQFWQLFLLTGPGGRWSLKTPPDIATNGALILASQNGTGRSAGTLITGVRPSLDLTFSPVTATTNGGGTWTTLPPDAGLADVPDALAASGGQLIALGEDQQVSNASTDSGSSSWTTLTSRRTLAATPAGRDCGLAGLTAVAYTPGGTPLLGGTCARAGTAGIFAYAGGTWQMVGPALPGALASQHIQVLRLTRTGSTDTALLQAGTGSSATLVAAWASDNARHWAVSAALRLGGAQPVSASFGNSGETAVTLTGNRGEILAGPGAAWRQLPALPPGRTVTLALPATGTTEALAADGSTMTAWQLVTGPAAKWGRPQVVKVPIEYGSSS